MLFCFDSREVQQNFETMIKSHTGHAVWWFWEIVYINFLLLISNWIMFHENCESLVCDFWKLCLFEIKSPDDWDENLEIKEFCFRPRSQHLVASYEAAITWANHVNLQSFDTDQAFGCNLWSLSICFWPLFSTSSRTQRDLRDSYYHVPTVSTSKLMTQSRPLSAMLSTFPDL